MRGEESRPPAQAAEVLRAPSAALPPGSHALALIGFESVDARLELLAVRRTAALVPVHHFVCDPGTQGALQHERSIRCDDDSHERVHHTPDTRTGGPGRTSVG